MSRPALITNRRALLGGVAASTFISGLSLPVMAATAVPLKAAPVPMKDVRLLPSPFLNAVEVNTKYLMSLEPDRLLHNYHKFAGLPVKGEIYGGWESDTIAGEALGHYLSALALMYAQTGNAECITRINYIIAELKKVQAAHGDGYVAGFMRKRKDGTVVDGKEIFPEIMAGDIRSAGFDLNGCWVPFYNWHKLYAGLLDVQALTGNDAGIPILVGLGGYIEKVFAALNDEQVQKVLACEYGGINESFAELYVRTKDARWLVLAERIYDNRNLDPLKAGEDKLANFHANTQVPKLVGLARLYEITGKPEYQKASSFFWERVTNHHSFAIGGNADREYFFEPDTISAHITEQTCESCNTYNMMKLTRHLYSWSPQASYFDYYERAHLNHILAHQHPETGMFTYMMPLMSGTAREYSTPFDSFWCCVLSGIESHSKHGDSIYWESGDTLFVNLFIPSTLNWATKKAEFELLTKYPYEGNIALKLKRVQGAKSFTVAVRIPGWAKSNTLLVNGKPALAKIDKGYALITRKWRSGDVVTLDLPLDLRFEAAAGNDKVVALLRGPMVMAADLGAAPKADEDPEYKGDAPALVGADLLAGIVPVSASEAIYKTNGIGRPGDLTFKPFYAQYERRNAVYFNRYNDAEWATAQVAFREEQARLKDLAARSVDVMYLGEMQPERDHNLTTGGNSFPVVYRGRKGRDARTMGFFQFDMKVTKDGKDAGPLVLQATYWGSEFNRSFTIEIDGTVIAHERLSGRQPGDWIDVSYPIPHNLTKGKSKVVVKFNPQEGKTAGPVFGVRLFTTAAAKAV
ncbi:glycoside hydrolase family 127 protein [Asticcacaulis machinosus]|uniref:Glycoside hydrolase family 127 protein n=1 Tax=Asticcacaulis machinosus TaxID=2984211 RepID=A0ABT5HMF1_9CAUL|nr:glycoside hydrolase family 127 protein [Asticcacaulis machinosus]MDC7677415.1 glycoside hydrolase family 127 protein [Asticcacaulis machinosus]